MKPATLKILSKVGLKILSTSTVSYNKAKLDFSDTSLLLTLTTRKSPKDCEYMLIKFSI